MSTKDPGSSTSRRTILRTVGTSGAVVTGLAVSTNSSAAQAEYESELQRLEDQYDSEQAIQQAVDEHASDVLQSLSERDVIESASASSLPLAESLEIEAIETSEGSDGVAATAIVEEDEPTGFIAISQTTDDHDLSLYVQPEREHAYAYVTDDDGTTLFKSASDDTPRTASAEDDSATILQSCDEVCYEARCTDESCYYFWNVGIDYRCCVDSSGNEDCSRTGTSGCQCGNRECQ